MENLIKAVEELILSKKAESGTNRQFYTLVAKNEINLFDESGSLDLIFNESLPENEENYSKTTKSIIDFVIQKMIAESPFWSMAYMDNLLILYKSIRNDLFYIQISDNHVYIHWHYSGQY